MVARSKHVIFRSSKTSGNGEAAAKALRERDDVRALVCEPAASTAGARLNLVAQDEQHVILVAPAAHGLQIHERRGKNSSFPDDGFQHDGRGLLVRVDISIRDMDEAFRPNHISRKW
ncbi:hypothetical protein ABID44_003673 [Aquamicrobium ahrensii]|uniref:Uncharacterized protein n=1 Tax=Aquamicrobium ahrensii TaxID=469551 RepID=A0ABV2KR65_9HYPH